jgi:hypothetical protein
VKEGVISYDSVLISEGTSGGPLLANNLRLLVGMQTSEGNAEVNHALDIFYLEKQLVDHDIPCDLGKYPVHNPLSDLK